MDRNGLSKKKGRVGGSDFSLELDLAVSDEVQCVLFNKGDKRVIHCKI